MKSLLNLLIKNHGTVSFFRGGSAIFLFSFLLSLTALAQAPTQTIRGQVLDADTREPLIGANVFLPETEPVLGTVSDLKGSFSIPNVEVGRYRLETSYLGYQSVFFPELLLKSGHELVLEVLMQKDTSLLLEAECVIYALRYVPLSEPIMSRQVITVEETQRFPATFDDPARLAMSYAGVVNANDQANNMVVRGNSPNGMSWHLEGAEIVNPNHLSNAGTASDRLTANGGGVNILSAQMLGTSSFLSGAFPAGNGNALSGIMDMKLRDGNYYEHEFTGQIGLIGIDLAAEGPLSSRKNGGSYLANYRYSTLGVLSAMGVDLGDEAIAFQDAAFHLKLPAKQLGSFSLFGMGGMSSNVFAAQRDTALWEVQKDRYDIGFDSKMGLLGLTHFITNGGNMTWRSSIVYSGLETSRSGEILSDNFEKQLQEYDSAKESKLAIHSTINLGGYAGAKRGFQLGMSALLLNNEVYSENAGTVTADGQGAGWLLQPFANYRLALRKPNLEFLAGLHFTHFTYSNSSSLEPRASIRWTNPNQKHQLSLAYGLHSKVQPAQLYFLQVPGLSDANKNLDLTKSHHLGLAHQWFFNKTTRLQTELYYQQLFDVPEVVFNSDTYSALNLVEAYITPPLPFSNTGKGHNYGIEISLQQYVTNGFYYLVNGSLYQSKYTDGNVERDTRFNGNYIFNLTTGKEFSREKKGRQRTIGINARLAYIGGFRETPIDEQRSAIAGYTVLQEGKFYSQQLPAYFKIDTRVYLRKDKQKYSHTLALDLQNTTNQKNLAYRYYDVIQKQIVDKYQLGLIPNISWRVEF